MYKVCLDPGHGSNTPGKRSPDGSFLEWEFNKDMVDRITKLLKPYTQISVMNSKGNALTDTTLTERCKRANAAKCDIFISIHANAASSSGWVESATGWEAWVYSIADARGKLATSMNNAYSAMFPSVKNRGVKVNAGYYVLNRTSMPAIIIEHGFYTCHKDMEMMKTNEYRDNAARACVNAIFKYFGITPASVPKPSIPATPTPTKGDKTMADNTACPEWKKTGEKYLEDKGILTSPHDPLELIDIGTFGVIMKNIIENLGL